MRPAQAFLRSLSLAVLLQSAHVVAQGTAVPTILQEVNVTIQGWQGLHDMSMVVANFGQIPFGSMLRGQLWYPHVEFGDGEGHECEEMPCNYGCDNFLQANPPFEIDNTAARIVMLDRVPEAQQLTALHCSYVEKAVNAQLIGASAVLLVASDEASVIAVVTETQELELLKQTLRIPVGMIRLSDGDWLRKRLVANSPNGVSMRLDFLNPIKQAPIVTVAIWHDSDDSCGERCKVMGDFIESFAASAQQLAESDKRVTFEPHYIFRTYTEHCAIGQGQAAYAAICKDNCVNDNRYCADDPTVPTVDAASNTNGRLDGAVVVAENVRQACMWHVLEATPGLKNDWWTYVLAFRQNCRSSQGKFNAECSMKTFKDAYGKQSYKEWIQCWQPLGTDAPIPAVEKEMLAATGQRGPGYATTSRIDMNPTILFNAEQYRGNLQKKPVLAAICGVFFDNEEPEVCQSLGASECDPGAWGTRSCAREPELHRTKCVETFMSFDCVCADGYEEMPTPDGKSTVCIDIDECALWTPCEFGTASTDKSAEDATASLRYACHNIPGSYECERDIPDECTEESNYGGCFTHSSGDKTTSACIDNLAAYQDAAINGETAPDLSYCECSEMYGCWKDGADGGCEPMCDESLCMEKLHTCSKSGRMPVWELLLIIFSGLAALVLLAGWFLRPLMQRMHKREGLLADLIAAKEGDNINGRYHAMEESDEFGVGAASSGGADIELRVGTEKV